MSPRVTFKLTECDLLQQPCNLIPLYNVGHAIRKIADLCDNVRTTERQARGDLTENLQGKRVWRMEENQSGTARVQAWTFLKTLQSLTSLISKGGLSFGALRKCLASTQHTQRHFACTKPTRKARYEREIRKTRDIPSCLLVKMGLYEVTWPASFTLNGLKIRSILSQRDAENLVHAFVTSRLLLITGRMSKLFH